MASEEELFISINPDSYRANKLNILTNQADLLSTLKRLQNLKVLARRKNDLKKKIRRHFITVLNNIESIQKSIPTPKVPSIIKQREAALKEEPEESEEVQEQASKREEIEDELMTIQEKLRELNG
jgi:DNA-binding transcriptional regulator GbsR (MarR family)